MTSDLLEQQLETIKSTVRGVQWMAENWQKKFPTPSAALKEIAKALKLDTPAGLLEPHTSDVPPFIPHHDSQTSINEMLRMGKRLGDLEDRVDELEDMARRIAPTG